MPTINEKQELAKKVDLNTKQNVLTAGTGISIVNNVISTTNTGGSTVTVTPVLSTGTRVAAMEVDGTIYTLFAPTPPSVGVTQVVNQGVELARVTINGVATSIYAPESSTVLSGTSAPSSSLGEDNNLYVQYTVESGNYTVDMTYVKLSGAWVELSMGSGTGNVDDVYVNGTSVLDSNKIAQITSYKEVTQAQYDALPASKLTDNILYCIKDASGGGGGNVDDVYVNGISVLDTNKIAQITSYKEVTQAEYNALPVSKLTDNVLYCIKDASGIPAHHYSENEQVIGTWIDGSTLYEITLSGTFSNTSASRTWHEILSATQVTVLGIDRMFLVGGYTVEPQSGEIYPLPMTTGVTTGVCVGCIITNGAIKVVTEGITVGTVEYALTIRYTKSTS